MPTPPDAIITPDYNADVAAAAATLDLLRAATTGDEAGRALTAVLLRPDPKPLLEQLEREGLLLRWLPDLLALRGVSQLPDHEADALTHSYLACAAAPPTELSRWTGLLHDIGKATTRLLTPEGRTRFFGHEKIGAEMAWSVLLPLGFPTAFVDDVACLINLHLRPLAYQPEWTDNAVRRLYDEAGPLWPALLAQGRADLLGYAPEPVETAIARLTTLAARVEALRKPRPRPPGSPLDGEELMRLFDRVPGPWLRFVKGALDTEVRGGRLKQHDKARAEQLARLLLQQYDATQNGAV